MNRLMKWVDEELDRDADLAARVDAGLTRLRVEQDLILLREEQGLSQLDLARRVGVSQPVIARIEAGRARNLQLRTLLKIVSALDGQVESQSDRAEEAPCVGRPPPVHAPGEDGPPARSESRSSARPAGAVSPPATSACRGCCTRWRSGAATDPTPGS